MRSIILCILLSFLFCSCVYGGSQVATPEQCKCLKNAIKWELRLNPPYKWGGASLDIGSPKDCSGFLYAIFKNCGFYVVRTTSLMMSRGYGGWNFRIVPFQTAKALTIIWWQFKKERVNGHVGILTEDVFMDEITMAAHASSSKGVTQSIVRMGKKPNYMGNHTTLLRSVTGD